MDRLQPLLRRAAAFLDRLSAKTETPRGRKISMAVSAVVFVVAMALGIKGLPSGDRELQWWAILLTSVVGVPVLIGLNAVEYIASGAVLGHKIGLRVAMPIAIYARAANLLPLPGSALVRMQGLKREGSSYGRAASATLATALFWLGGSLLVSAVVLIAVRPWLALLFGAGGVLVSLVGHTAVRSLVARREDAPPGEALRRSAVLLGVEILMVLVRGVRFWLVMVGFDIGGSFAGAMLLPLAGVLSSAIGFFPSGFGIREVISGALSRLVGDPASSGLLASGLDRLVSLPVMAVIALIVGVMGRRDVAGAADVVAGEHVVDVETDVGPEPVPDAGIRVTDVLYLLGKGRSGSTLVSMALGELDGFFAAGELRFFWRRGLVEDRRCACGEHIRACPVWGAVADRVADLDAEALARDSEEVYRWGAAPRLLAGRTEGWEAFARWSAATTRLVGAVAEVTGAEVIVDSSKWPTEPGVLGRVEGIRPLSVLLVRDPRGVAWSWKRTKTHHDMIEPREMDRFPPWHSALSWTSRNLVVSLATRRSSGPRMTLHYEQFTADPYSALADLGAFTGREPDVDAVLDGRTLALTQGHTLAGNPTRFSETQLVIREDEEWRTELPRRDRLVVTTLTWPLRKRYDY